MVRRLKGRWWWLRCVDGDSRVVTVHIKAVDEAHFSSSSVSSSSSPPPLSKSFFLSVPGTNKNILHVSNAECYCCEGPLPQRLRKRPSKLGICIKREQMQKSSSFNLRGILLCQTVLYSQPSLKTDKDRYSLHFWKDKGELLKYKCQDKTSR